MKQPKDYLIFPLDVPTLDKAMGYVDRLSDVVGTFKVGLELFIKSGPEIIRQIKTHAPRSKIFLDLKLHDIPETVHRAMRQIARFGVDMTTVHCGESPRMLEAAVQGADGKVAVLGVTVLTSVGSGDLIKAGYDRTIAEEMSMLVLKKAGMASMTGCAGVICSPLEANVIKKKFSGDFLAVTPGVRPVGPGSRVEDQVRIATPARAVKNGSDYLVVGRPIRDAGDPVAAAQAILSEIEMAITPKRGE